MRPANIADQVVLALSVSSFFCVFFLTSCLNLAARLKGKEPFTHGTSMLATKVANIAMLGGLASLSFSGVIGGVEWMHYVYLFICINVAANVNWNLFAITDTSMHSKLLTTINTQGPISHADLLGLYNRERIFAVRLPRLIQLGQIKDEGGRLKISGGFVLFGARLLALFRRLLGIPVRPKLVDSTSPDPASVRRQGVSR